MMSSELTSNFLQFSFGMDKANDHRTYEFDHFRLDPAKLMLYKAGSEISLRRRS